MIDCEKRFALRAWRTSSRSLSEWPPPKTPNDCGSSAHRLFSSTATIHSPMEAHLVSAAASIRHSMALPVHLRLSSYAKHSAVSDPHGARACQKLLPRLGRSYFRGSWLRSSASIWRPFGAPGSCSPTRHVDRYASRAGTGEPSRRRRRRSASSHRRSWFTTFGTPRLRS
jgi:hypothetical protein